jgi:hypothetical protein
MHHGTIWLKLKDRAYFSFMDRLSILKVGSIELTVPPQIKIELLAALRDDMRHEKYVSVREYWPDFGPSQEGDPLMPIQEYSVVGHVLAERLDLIGFDAGSTIAMVDGALDAARALGMHGLIEANEHALLRSLDATVWVDRLQSATDDLSTSSEPSLSSRRWLLELINGFSFLRQLRALLLAFPDAQVTFDGTQSDIPPNEEISVWNSSDAVAALRHKASAHAPVIVLTEGKTDAEFLSVALAILYPHLTDLIRFLDYERKAEGGVGALVNTIRAFAAAGILNRVVAVFDNDTAAADGLRNVDIEAFAPQIQILRYPELELAMRYPTLGPPTQQSVGGSLLLANVNGLAGSIELYLGKDVLTQEDGSLQPIQWTSFSQGMRQYQGEITNKSRIHDKFRAKYKRVIDDPEAVHQGDWNGLRAILDSIRKAAQQTYQIEGG